jgi:hypothetical protein
MLAVVVSVRLGVTLRLAENVELTVSESSGVGVLVGVCEAETVLVGDGEKVGGDGVASEVGSTVVSSGVGTLK